MSAMLLTVYLARHGETAWSLSGQHTGLTDLPLTERGERNARHLGNHLRGRSFARVFTSPLQRARRTCELAGFGAEAKVDNDLVEWNYGEYEGLRTPEIHAKRPGWQLFRDGCPGLATTPFGAAWPEKDKSYDFSLSSRHATRVTLLLHTAETIVGRQPRIRRNHDNGLPQEIRRRAWHQATAR
jgi:broad specificity phosphatase PhoE